MTDYTPTTEDVRNRWGVLPYFQASFDRWLASVKAEAWERGYASAPVGPHPRQENPYRAKETT